MQATIARWQARRDVESWYARRIREGMISKVSMDLASGLRMIKTLIAVCPLVGLLGTVTGMIGVFEIMALTGTGNARAMAAGIYQATIPTMSGLVIALSGLFFSARLDQRAKEERDKLADMLRYY
jgi:biopolymer transport protein ExbB